jgi:uncharacterized membrane protein YhhN
MTTFLSFIALISAIVTIYAKVRENDSLQYVFKPLTMLAIISIAMLNVSAPSTFYQKMILVGLIFSTVGDVFLIDSRRFVQGLTSFLLAHVCFVIAFFTTPNLPSAIFYFAYVTFFLSILWRHLGNLKIPVIFYSFALTAMSWLALSRYFQFSDYKSLLAFIGSIFFVASDSLLALNKFKRSFPFAEIAILSTYFAAQWLIALSI